MRRLFVAGNWKMCGNRQSSTELAAGLAAAVPRGDSPAEVAVFPPYPYLEAVGGAIAKSGIALGAQNAYFEKPGAFTGEVAVEMLLDLGCRWVILGHSERRHILGESNELISRKVQTAVKKGLNVILCVGELADERNAGKTEAVLDAQLSGSLQGIEADAMPSIVIAYEPVWAIGTNVTATPTQANSAHAHLRTWLTNRYNSEIGIGMRILYGGSVKKENAADLLSQPNVDGALVGGASLKVADFVPIIQIADGLKK